MTEMNQGNAPKRLFTRRAFLKATAAAGVLMGTVATNPVQLAAKAIGATNQPAGAANAGEQIFFGACRVNCTNGCRLKIKVRNNKVVQTEMAEFPDPRYNRICLRGLALPQRIYGPTRLKYPLKRVGERGAGQWQRISWEEAVGTITDAWKKLQSQYGKSCVAYQSGSGNFGSMQFFTMGRLFNLMGATKVDASVDNAFFYATMNALGSGFNLNGNEIADLLSAKTILIWGGNPTISQLQSWHFIQEAKNSGAKVIVIDPNYTSTAAKADIHVVIKPGTDAVLAMAMANYIIDKGLIDEKFMKRSSVAPLLVKKTDGTYLRQKDLGGTKDDLIVVDSVTGKHRVVTEVSSPAIRGSYVINGIEVTTAYDLLIERIKPYTIEKAEEICEVPAAVIREIAQIYAGNTPSSIITGLGPDHYVNGHSAIFAQMMLGIITGNIGKPGATTGYFLSIGAYINLGGLMFPPGVVPGPAISSTKLLQVVEEGKFGDHPLQLKSFYVYSANPVGNMAQRKALIKAMNKMELVVVADVDMTDTAQYADIVLPVAHCFEYTDIVGTGCQVPFLKLQEKAIEPLYESKSDWQIISLLGKSMGFGQHFTMTHEDLIKLALDSDYCRMVGITYERLLKEKVLRDVPPKTYIYGEDGIFPTPTKRAQFYLENPIPQFKFGQKLDVERERLPYWEPPSEAWSKNPLFKKYPIIYTTERPKFRVHTQWSHTPWLRELDPEPTVKINPKDAATRGINDGDRVKIYNDRGYVVIKAVISNGTRPGMVVIPKGWQRDQFIEGHYQDLTSNETNSFCINNCYFDVLVEVKRI